MQWMVSTMYHQTRTPLARRMIPRRIKRLVDFNQRIIRQRSEDMAGAFAGRRQRNRDRTQDHVPMGLGEAIDQEVPHLSTMAG